MIPICLGFLFFFFNDTATTEIYTLSLHDALPISGGSPPRPTRSVPSGRGHRSARDRKSTRLNSSHVEISYAVFCLKKKNHNQENTQNPSTNYHNRTNLAADAKV